MTMAKLCKEVCQKCYRTNGWNWDRFLDENWENGRLYCVTNGRILDGYIKLDTVYVRMKAQKGLSLDKMPVGCPYRFEHIVLGNQKK